MSLSRSLQYAFIAIVTISVGFSLYQWNASRAASTVKLNSSPTASLTSGLVGYWTFDGKDTPWSSSSAGTATDRSGNSNTGTLTNMSRATSPADGKLGQALNFDGVDDYMIIPSSSTFNISTTATYSAWVKAVLPGSGYEVLRKWTDSVEDKFIYIGSTGQVVFYLHHVMSGVALTSNTFLTSGNWTHIVGTYDGTTAKIYINGVLDNSKSASGDVWDSNSAMIFGYNVDGGNSYLNGSIDEVRIYNRALSAGEVQSLYDLGASDKVNSSVSQNQGTGRLDSGLAGYWKLDDASGTTATDSSTNANNGTLTNGPTWGTGQIGGAVDFDGSNDYVTVGDPASGVLDFADGTNFTLSGWFNRDTFTTDDMIISKRSVSSSNIGYVLYVDDATDKLTFNGNDGTDSYQLESATAFTATGWYHYAIVWDDSGSGQTKLYINGIAESATATGTFGNVNSMANGPAFLIGATTDGLDVITSTFDGKLDEVRVYNRALSADEVSQLYRLNRPSGTDTSLKGYWSFNGKDTNWTSSSAGTVSDLSGSGNTGTMTNMSRTTSPVEGKLGQALNFDGVDDFVQASNASSLQFANATPITLSAWVKPSQVAAYASFLVKGRDTTDNEGNYAFRQTSSDKLEFYYNESGNTNWHVWTTTSAVFSAANQWYHVAVTYTFGTGSSIRAYINGESVAGSWSSGTGNVAPDISTQKLMIGQITTGERFTGLIDEVRIYNRALIASEIASLYNNGKVVLNSTKKIYITTPGAGTFSAPADWPGTADKVEVIGGGAAGGYASNLSLAGAGGGGGAYARKSNVAISNGASLQVGSGGVSSGGAGGDTWVVSTGTIKAVGAPSHTYNVAGIGGAAGSSVGDTVYSGGNGGSILAQISMGGGGGGGAAGPRGAGKNGGNSGNGTCCEISGGGGGGGAAGGSSTAGSNSGTGDGAGASGGKAQDNTAGGTANNNGSHGSGAGGGGAGGSGASGGNGVEFDSTHGAGGGGGGGGGGGSSSNGGAGGAGGRYGGGGGGGGNDAHDNWQPGGSGGQGIIVITYTPS